MVCNPSRERPSPQQLDITRQTSFIMMRHPPFFLSHQFSVSESSCYQDGTDIIWDVNCCPYSYPNQLEDLFPRRSKQPAQHPLLIHEMHRGRDLAGTKMSFTTSLNCPRDTERVWGNLPASHVDRFFVGRKSGGASGCYFSFQIGN